MTFANAESSAALALSNSYSGVISSLEGGSSTCIALIGDATGDEAAEWYMIFARMMADVFPELRTEYVPYDRATGRWRAPTVLRSGKLGERYLNMTRTRTRSQPLAYTTPVVGDIEVEVKVALSSIASGDSRGLMAQWGAAGERSWNLWIDAANRLAFSYTTNGTDQIDAKSTAPLANVLNDEGNPIGADYPLRIKASRMSASGAVLFSTSVNNGSSWVALGDPRATTPGNMFAPVYPMTIGGRGDVNELTTGRFYDAIVRAGVDGPVANIRNIESWVSSGAVQDTNTIEGSPTLYLMNGSVDAGTLDTHFNNPAFRSRLFMSFDGGLCFLSTGTNEGADHGAAFLARMDGWLAAVKARAPAMTFAVLTQNPMVAPVSRWRIEAHRKRVSQIPFWAARNGVSCIDTYRAFLKDGRPLSDLIAADGRNLLAAGSKLWADVVLRAFAARFGS